LPPLLGFIAFALSIIALNFQWIYAQVQYNMAVRQPNTVLAVNTDSESGIQRPQAAPSVWVPSINVHAPVIFESSNNEKQIQASLRQGVVHYADTANPGEAGNVVLFGHSSGQPWAPGDYKFVFTLLNKLKKNDQVVIDYKGIRYVYSVTKSFVVDPYQTSVLRPTDKSSVTLITCTPVGTNAKRLVVIAEQVSPRPIVVATTKKDKDTASVAVPRKLPGDALSFWQSVTSRSQ